MSAAQAHLAGQVDACGHDASGVVLQAAGLNVEALEEQQRRVLQEAAAAAATAAEVAASCCRHDGAGSVHLHLLLFTYTATPHTMQLLQLDYWREH
jgi:hypothetical protein